MPIKPTYTLEELISNAGCTRDPYSPGRCMVHGRGAYPDDEHVCNQILMVLGVKPRVYLGDGRARGVPILPRKTVS